MQTVASFWEWFKHSGLGMAEIQIPLVETTVLFVILTICLLFRYSRTGLLVAYLFVYRWGWAVRDKANLADQAAQNTFTIGYLVCGILVFTFAIVGLIHAARSENTGG